MKRCRVRQDLYASGHTVRIGNGFLINNKDMSYKWEGERFFVQTGDGGWHEANATDFEFERVV